MGLFSKSDPYGTRKKKKNPRTGKVVTFEKVKPHGKNQNLTTRIVKND